jgi:hypothetical protein
MLHSIAENSPIDLLLNVSGGDVDACENGVTDDRADKQEFRVIVPDMAKSQVH